MRQNKGFTLLEILLVIAAIGILASIVLVAINPNRQIEAARNAKRKSDINTITKAIQQYSIDNNGQNPTGIETGAKAICRNGTPLGCIDLSILAPDYLASIPEPDSNNYYVRKGNNSIEVSHPRDEIWNIGGTPSLDLNFASNKSLIDNVSGKNLIDFARNSPATYVGEDGLIKTAGVNEPRFDHDPTTGESLGLLVEEGRENRYTQSVNFNFTTTSNITETNVFNPDGTYAIRRVPLSTGSYHGTDAGADNFDITNQVVGGTTDISTSIFVRNYNNSNLRLLIGLAAYDGISYRYFLTNIDTANPTTLGIPSGAGWSNGYTKIENYGNGWYRYTLSGRYTKVSGFNTIVPVGAQIHSSTGQQFWDGDNVSGIYVWGRQLELGSFPTSYIPTSGATIPRTADNANISSTNFSSWYNSTEGSVYADTKVNGVQTGRYDRLWAITNSNFNLEGISLFVAGPNTPSASYISSITITNDATEQVGGALVETAFTTPRLKSVFAFKQNNSASSYNGQLRFIDNTVTLL